MSRPIMLIAVAADTFQRLKDNFRLVDPTDPTQGYVQNDLTDAQRDKLLSNFLEHWLTPTFQGTVYHIVALQVSEKIDDNGKLVWVEWLLNKWPSKFILIGVWNRDGTQFGTTRVPAVYDYSDPMAPVLVTPASISGTPVYPVPAQATPAKIMPPDVIYDANGAIVSSSAASDYKPVFSIFGYSDPVWI